MRKAQIQEIIKLNASLPFYEVVELIEEEFGKSNIYNHTQWRIIYNKYRISDGVTIVYLGSKTKPYYTNEDDYGKSDRLYNSADEVNDFTENCKLSFSERLKITQLYLR
jgi:hypothetical protein